MPDLDILHTGAVRGWYRPARLAKGNAPPEEVAEAIIKSLAGELRRRGGFPRLSELCGVLMNVAEGQTGVQTGFERLQGLERTSGGAPHLRVGCQAARAVLVGIAEGQVTSTEIERVLATEYCHHLVQNRFFGRIPLRLVGKRFADVAAAQDWADEVSLVLAPDLIRLADSLPANPTAHNLRAPRRQVPRRSTADLLHEPLFGEVRA